MNINNILFSTEFLFFFVFFYSSTVSHQEQFFAPVFKNVNFLICAIFDMTITINSFYIMKHKRLC